MTRAGSKLLDFGLAKLRQTAAPASAVSIAATAGNPLTVQGTILGTLQYMSPEQLESQEADARTDIFAFGAVLYEMITGRKAFAGKSQASLIGAILQDNPTPVSALQPIAPRSLDRIVETCLAKDPDDRWQSARDLLRELRWIAAAPRDAATPAGAGTRRASTRLWPAVAVLFGLAAVTLGAVVLYLSRAADTALPVRFTIPTPEGADRLGFTPGGGLTPSIAVSPDGRWLVFGAVTGTNSRLWLRPLDALAARPLSGTEGARYPFWSPDSRSIAFLTQGDLRKVDVAGGTSQKIADADNGTGGTWNRDGTILVGLVGRGLFRVPATGGDLVPVASSAGPERIVGRSPFFLPDDRHFVYLGQSERSQNDALYLGSLESSDRTRLLTANRKAEYASGELLFVSGQMLMAQPFDLRSLRLVGVASPAAEPVATSTNGYAAFSVSENGVLVTASSSPPEAQLTWFDRSGKRVGRLGSPGVYNDILFGPTIDRVVLQRPPLDSAAGSLWILDTARNTESRITTGDNAVVSPDGQSIAFNPGPEARSLGIRRLGLANPGTPEELLRAPIAWPTDWSANGRFILFVHPQASNQFDISVLDLDGGRTVRPFVQTTADEGQARFSPDQRWVAYQSNESGRLEIYVRHFPDGGRKTAISNGGGTEPRWDRRGRELFYLSADGSITGVSVRADADRLLVGTPQPLFHVRVRASSGMFGGSYAPADDGRFLVSELVGEQTGPRLNVVLNWPATLKK